MNIGELLQNIMMPSLSQGSAGAPAPAPAMAAPQPVGSPPAPAPGGPAMVAPAAGPAAPAAAPAAPPDLGELYQKLLKEDRSTRLMDSGMTLLAAGFAQPQNRAALIAQAGSGGGSSGGGAAQHLQTLMTLQKQAADKAAKLQMKQRLPSIAKQYGLDMDTVNFLFESGKLDETINSLAQPNTEVVSRNDGSKYIINKRNGATIKELGGADPLANATSDQKELAQVNAERKAQGLEPIAAEKWFETASTNKAAKQTVTIGDSTEKAAAMKRIDDLTTKAGAVETGMITLERLNSARDALDKGVMTGSVLANPVKEGRKVLAQAFGISDTVAENTDLFQSQMKELVLPRVKALGSGSAISNADREFVEQAIGASGSITPETAREIMRIMEKGERNAARRYSREVEDFSKIEGMEKAGKLLKRFQLPPPRAKPETIVKLREEVAKGNKDAIKQFDDYFGDGSAESVLGAQ